MGLYLYPCDFLPLMTRMMFWRNYDTLSCIFHYFNISNHERAFPIRIMLICRERCGNSRMETSSAGLWLIIQPCEIEPWQNWFCSRYVPQCSQWGSITSYGQNSFMTFSLFFYITSFPTNVRVCKYMGANWHVQLWIFRYTHEDGVTSKRCKPT